MFALTVRQAIDGARLSQLDEISRTLWKAHSSGLLGAEDAQGLAEAIEARRALGRASEGVQKLAARRVGSKPRSANSLERRRRWVAAGMTPPTIAASFTQGEAAVLAVIAIEVQKRGQCDLFLAAIAATAGVSITTTKNALREAKRLGLIEVRERRLTWTRNLSNVVRIVSSEWSAWLRMGARKGGGKLVPATPTKHNLKPFTPFEKRRREGRKRTLGLARVGSLESSD